MCRTLTSQLELKIRIPRAVVLPLGTKMREKIFAGNSKAAQLGFGRVR